MKSVDEIKKGLKEHAEDCCSACPYWDDCNAEDAMVQLAADALALIQQLESKFECSTMTIDGLTATLLKCNAIIEQLQAERDALLNDLREADMIECEHCKHYRINDPECSCECGTCINPCPCNECYHNNLWAWRGITKEDNDK